jgi:hypothetical protein
VWTGARPDCRSHADDEAPQWVRHGPGDKPPSRVPPSAQVYADPCGTVELAHILSRTEDAHADDWFVGQEMMGHAEAPASGKLLCEPAEMARALVGWTRRIDAALGVLRQEVGRTIADAIGVPGPPANA